MGIDIGELIRAYRQREDISLSELAERTGVSKTSLSKLESGETKRPGFALWKKIASTINIPYADSIGIYLNVTEQPTAIKLLLEEAVSLNSPALVQKAALRLLETPRMDTLLALDHLLQAAKGMEDRHTKLALYEVVIDYTRKRGIPYYLAKGLYERYLLERDDFSQFEETYHRGKELLHYIDFLQPHERLDFYYRIGVHASILDFHGECIDFCGKRIREDQTDSSQKAYALITLFDSYIALGDLILAEYCLKEYENSNYADFRKKHFRAVLNTKKGQFEEAIQLYKECLHEVDRDRRISIVIDLLEVYLEMGRADLIKELIDSEDDFLPANINIHPYRIKIAARYFKRKGVCQLSVGLTNEGFDSLLQSINYYRQLGDCEKAMECLGDFLQHHRLSGEILSSEHMEKIENLCHNKGNQ